jgi:formate dehydrogenase assembly factor FdhD
MRPQSCNIVQEMQPGKHYMPACARASQVVIALKDAAANGATVIAAVARPTELALQTADR